MTLRELGYHHLIIPQYGEAGSCPAARCAICGGIQLATVPIRWDECKQCGVSLDAEFPDELNPVDRASAERLRAYFLEKRDGSGTGTEERPEPE